MTDRLLEQIKEFAKLNEYDFEMTNIDDDGFSFVYNTSEGVDVEIRFDNDKIDSFDDLRDCLIEASRSYSADEHFEKRMGFTNPNFLIEHVVNQVKNLENSQDRFEELVGKGCRLEDAIALIEDAYAVSNMLEEIAYSTKELGQQIEKETVAKEEAVKQRNTIHYDPRDLVMYFEDFIEEKYDELYEHFEGTEGHTATEAKVVHDFTEKVFSEFDEDFIPDPDEFDLHDIAYTYAHDKYHYHTSVKELNNWLVSPETNGKEQFERIAQERMNEYSGAKGDFYASKFDFDDVLRQARIEEAVNAIEYAAEQGLIQPVIAAKYMRTQGHLDMNMGLMSEMADKIDTMDLSAENMENVFTEANKELGLNYKLRHSSKDIER